MFGSWKSAQSGPTPSSPAAKSISSISSLESSAEDLALNMSGDDSAVKSPAGAHLLRLHEHYYFHETNVQLVVEDVIYNLPRTILSRISTRFRECFEKGPDVLPPGWSVHKTDLGEHLYINYAACLVQKTRPSAVGPFADAYPLFGVAVPEFDALLSVIFREHGEVDKAKDKSKWLAVLKLATLFDIPFIRALSLGHLSSPSVTLTPVERLQIGRTQGINEWVDDALQEMVQRAEPLREDEAELLTAKEIVKLVALSREQSAGRCVDEALHPTDVTIDASLQGGASSVPSPQVYSLIPSLAGIHDGLALPAATRPASPVSPQSVEEQTLQSVTEAPPPPPEADLVDKVHAVETQPVHEAAVEEPVAEPEPEPEPKKTFKPLTKAQQRKLEREQKATTAFASKQASNASTRTFDKLPTRAPSPIPEKPGIRAPSPTPPPPEKSPPPQPNADAGGGLPSFLNASPSEESGGFGLGGLLGDAAKKAPGWGRGGFGGGASGPTSPNPQQEVPNKKIDATGGAAVPAPAAAGGSAWGGANETKKPKKKTMEGTWGAAAKSAPRDSAWGGGGGDKDDKDEGWAFGSAIKGKGKGSAWGAMADNNNSGSLGGTGWNDTTSFFDTLGSDPAPLADGLHCDTAAGAGVGEQPPISAVPSSALTDDFSRLTTPPGERADGGEEAPAGEQKDEEEKDEEGDDWWWDSKKRKTGAKGAGATPGTITGTSTLAIRSGKGKKGKR